MQLDLKPLKYNSMKSKWIFFIILISICLHIETYSSDQDSRLATKDFLSSIRNTYITNEKIIIVNNPETKEFKNCLDWIFKDSLIISRTSKESIIHQIEHPDVMVWTSEMIPRSIIIDKDSLATIFKGDYTKGWNYFSSNYGKEFFIFSLPVFFNNDTMCLFYVDRHCGEMCNEGEIVLYKKEKKGWAVIKRFCSWMS